MSRNLNLHTQLLQKKYNNIKERGDKHTHITSIISTYSIHRPTSKRSQETSLYSRSYTKPKRHSVLQTISNEGNFIKKRYISQNIYKAQKDTTYIILIFIKHERNTMKSLNEVNVPRNHSRRMSKKEHAGDLEGH